MIGDAEVRPSDFEFIFAQCFSSTFKGGHFQFSIRKTLKRPKNANFWNIYQIQKGKYEPLRQNE